ncbi:MAG: NusG domain II-containing protein [Oscillospiraceae bacterium]|nr:NusG domain II-containing protein [Oscillospiraceae bacterium]
MENRKKFLKKSDLILIAVLLLAALAGGLWYRAAAAQGGRNIAVITVDGKEYMRLDLNREEDQLIHLQDTAGVPVSFEILDHKIRFVQVSCPDHICENTGFVYLEGQSAVCMPNRTSVWIGGEEDVRVVAG